MSEWSSVSISECCEILDSRRIPVNEEERNARQGITPYYGANGLQGFIDGFIFDEPLILIAEDGGYFDEFASRPIAYRIEGKSWVNNHAHILRSKAEFDQNFIFYCLEHKDVTPFIKGGTRAKLNQSELRQITVPCPPLPQQRKIARILTTIDNLIEKTEALIAKYQAIKQGMMHDLFTRGVDEHGHLRPPYEEAPELYRESELGWIPKEWEVKALSSATVLITKGATPTTYGFDFVEYGVRFIRGENLSENGDYSYGDKWISEEANNFLRRSMVRPNDLILGIVGTLGNFIIVNDFLIPANISQNVALIRCDSNSLLPLYLSSVLQTHGFKSQVDEQVTVQAQPSINLGQVGDFSIALPYLYEQERIVERLVAIHGKLKSEFVLRDKVKNLKSGLMQDLLTGKVRVKVDVAEEVASV